MSKNTNNIKVGDILTEEQLDEVLCICLEQDEENIVKHLKAYLGQFKDQLETKGILPEFLAWYLYYRWIFDTKKGKSNGHV